MKEMSILKLVHYVKEIVESEEFKERARTSSKFFTRLRKIRLCDIIYILIVSGAKNLQTEIKEYFEKRGRAIVSRQAFAKAREKVNPEAIKELNERVAVKLELNNKPETYKGYRLIAVDGTILDLPNTEALRNHFGCSTNNTEKTYCKSLAMIAYDVLNHYVLWGEMYRYDDSEKIRMREISDIFAQRESTKNPLFILDRGYPHLELMRKFEENNQKYIVRVSRNSLKEINEAKAKDSIVKIKRKDTCLKVRVVNIVLDNGNTEKIVTNENKLTVEEIKELYSKRWGVETCYHYLKNTELLECFTGQTVFAVMQDFYTSLLIINFAAPVYKVQLEILDENQGDKKHRYKPSRSQIIYDLKMDYVVFLTAEKQSHNIFKKYRRFKYIRMFAYLPGKSRERQLDKRSHRKTHPKSLL